MKKEIRLKPIGIIYTPYKDIKGMPIQGKFEKNVIGRVEVFQKYQKGLKDVNGFSHLILIYYFNRAREENLIGKPFLEKGERGIFSIRSPFRPNRLGISIVKIKNVKNNIITFSEVDILDKTPLLDIKPYVTHYDSRENVKNGWIDKHFEKSKMPANIILE